MIPHWTKVCEHIKSGLFPYQIILNNFKSIYLLALLNSTDLCFLKSLLGWFYSLSFLSCPCPSLTWCLLPSGNWGRCSAFAALRLPLGDVTAGSCSLYLISPWRWFMTQRRFEDTDLLKTMFYEKMLDFTKITLVIKQSRVINFSL